ncbi:hypothetical protein CXU15_00870 [Akkermansia muciniphila]|jgi:hypothetical protein|uniref:Uncharacterized protein n=6 Tax=Akkermansiaceae TaxID=1647988 RepID=A0A6N2RL70_9BACT|nr:hypothetical protein CXU11_07240 [Akkermansia muciniphila]PNC52533.1 hypothetical protein CXU15_00870 [Akkermansia muciniphila]QHV61973.1 hypothetical protein DMI76_00655 [Akkermansia massiliensis]QHV74340.1 hypothetical protein DMI75_00655 [Akkermansia massiliensis]GKI08043.1 hypothetical protein CE91St27_01250 [Akkermansia muciniphila]
MGSEMRFYIPECIKTCCRKTMTSIGIFIIPPLFERSMNNRLTNITIVLLAAVSLVEGSIIWHEKSIRLDSQKAGTEEKSECADHRDDDFVPDISSQFPHLYFKNQETQDSLSAEVGTLIIERTQSRQSAENRDYAETETHFINPNETAHLPPEIKNTSVLSILWTSDSVTTKTEENSLFMEIGKKSLSPLKLTLTLRAKDGMGREWKLAWVKANED